MRMIGVLLVMGVASAGVATTAHAEGARRFKLERSAPRVGDRFAVEQRTTYAMGTKGAAETVTLDTRSGFQVSVLGQDKDGFTARFDYAESRTDSVLEGAKESEVAPARSVTAHVAPGALAVGPGDERKLVEGIDAKELDVLGVEGRESVAVGETWRAERALLVAKDLLVPLKTVYRVAGVLQDGRGHEVLKLELQSEGSVEIAGTPVRLVVSGRGTALVDPLRADRPLEVRITYRTLGTGGEGPDSESRADLLLRTRELPGTVASTVSATR